MKKNIIVLAVDSLSYKVIKEYPFHDDLFINRILEKSYVLDNLFTEGPFTEASLNGLIAGTSNLECGSYMFSYTKCKNNIFNVMKNNGYKLYFTGITDNFMEGFKSYKYSPSIAHLSYGRINDFRERLINNGYLSEKEKECIKTIIQFYTCKEIHFCKDYIEGNVSTSMQQGYLNVKQVEENYNNYMQILKNLENENFLLDLISSKDKLNHIAPTFDINVGNKELENVLLKYRKLFFDEEKKHFSKIGLRDIRRKYIIKALKRPSLSNFKNIFTIKKNIHKSIIRQYDINFSFQLIKEKNSISFRRHVDDLINFVKSTKGQPFFAYVQPQDFHPTSTFYSYDLDNNDEIVKELESAYELAKSLPKTIKCNIFALLSLKYVDNQIKRLFSELEKAKILENTDIVITSDHGYWDLCDCHRDNNFAAMTEERLHIPGIIYTKTITGHNKKLLNSCCLPNTIFELCGIGTSNDFSASAFKEKSSEYIVSENFSFGSPDLFYKPIYYTIHNSDYKLVVKCLAHNKISLSDCIEFYNLKKDKYEIHNVVRNRKYKDIINEMFLLVNDRHFAVWKKLKSDYLDPPERTKMIINEYLKQCK